MFRSIISTYYRGAHGVLLMFDVTRRATFEAIPSWLEEVRLKAPEAVPVLLVGNKCDCEGRAVEAAEAQAWAAARRFGYVETSAKNNLRINEAFVRLVAAATGRADELEALLGTACVHQAYGGAPAAAAGGLEIAGGMAGGGKRRSAGGCAC